MIEQNPQVQKHVHLVLNAHPHNVHLQHILNRQGLSSDNISIYGNYYLQGGLDDTHLHALMCSANVFVNPCCGDDFDPVSFLAQQYWKPVIYHQVMQVDKHMFFGLKVTKNQKWWSAPASAPLYLPNIEQLSSLLLYVHQNYHKFKPLEAIRDKINNFPAQKRHFRQTME